MDLQIRLVQVDELECSVMVESTEPIMVISSLTCKFNISNIFLDLKNLYSIDSFMRYSKFNFLFCCLLSFSLVG